MALSGFPCSRYDPAFAKCSRASTSRFALISPASASAIATASTYVIASSQVGRTLRAYVTAAGAGGSTTASSAATAVVVGVAPENTALPRVTGAAAVGSTLTVTPGTRTGTPTISLSYSWKRCNAAGGSCVAIGSATKSTYLLVAADAASTIRVDESARNGVSTTVGVSAATWAIATHTPVSTAPLAVTGTLRAGSIVTAAASWSEVVSTTAYQWSRCTVAGYAALPGETAATYAVVTADAGAGLRSP